MLCLEETDEKMIFKTFAVVAFFTVSKIHESVSNDTGSVSFDRLELQIEKISKYDFMKFNIINL
jgi:hypothetical protein